MDSITVGKSECTGCRTCVEVCPRGVFEMVEEPEANKQGRVPSVTNEEACFMCMACVAACPPNCISIPKPSPERLI